MGDNDSFFGWHRVFSVYGTKNFLLDSWCPFLLAIVLVGCGFYWGDDTYEVLGKLLDLGIDMLPVLLSLLIAAYAIILPMFFSKTAEDIAEEEDGEVLLEELNSDFALSIYVSLVSVFVIIVASFIRNLSIKFIYADVVNVVVAVIILYLIFYALKILKDLVIAVFNIGQVAICLRNNRDSD